MLEVLLSTVSTAFRTSWGLNTYLVHILPKGLKSCLSYFLRSEYLPSTYIAEGFEEIQLYVQSNSTPVLLFTMVGVISNRAASKLLISCKLSFSSQSDFASPSFPPHVRFIFLWLGIMEIDFVALMFWKSPFFCEGMYFSVQIFGKEAQKSS